MLQRQFFRLAVGAVLLSGLAGAHAVELGDARVRSHLGQALSADIELIGAADEKSPLQAGLADPDVYRGANIAMHPALSAATITVIARDGKRYLRIWSPKRVESELVNVFFELTENGQRSVRQVTLWLKPDPNPAPSPAKVAAAPAAVAPPLPLPLPVRGAIVAPLARAAPAAACVQQFSAAQIGVCTAQDARNTALKAQIADLEEKVRRLTAAVQAGAAPAPAPAARPSPPLPAAKASAAPLTPMGAAPAEPAAATPWLFIGSVAGAAVLALAGALLFVVRRKRKAARGNSAPKAGPGFIASVKNRLLATKKEFRLTPAEESPGA